MRLCISVAVVIVVVVILPFVNHIRNLRTFKIGFAGNCFIANTSPFHTLSNSPFLPLSLFSLSLKLFFRHRRVAKKPEELAHPLTIHPSPFFPLSLELFFRRRWVGKNPAGLAHPLTLVLFFIVISASNKTSFFVLWRIKNVKVEMNEGLVIRSLSL